jgi:hypothetical protein
MSFTLEVRDPEAGWLVGQNSVTFSFFSNKKYKASCKITSKKLSSIFGHSHTIATEEAIGMLVRAL